MFYILCFIAVICLRSKTNIVNDKLVKKSDLLPVISYVLSNANKRRLNIQQHQQDSTISDYKNNISKKKRKATHRREHMSKSVGELNCYVYNELDKIPLDQFQNQDSMDRNVCKIISKLRLDKKNKSSMLSKYAPMSLQFNEASFLAIASWSFKDSFDDLLGPRPETSYNIIPPPNVVEPFFQRCSLCKLWGHCDVECKDTRSSPDDIIYIANEIRRLRKVQRVVTESLLHNKGKSWQGRK